MTLSIAENTARRTAKAAPSTLYGAIADVGERAASWCARLHWPSTKYQADPVGFARDILGIEPWSRQIELLEAVRDNLRVAVKSGHKVSKSNSLAILALWYFASYESATIVLSSTTARQVDEILYREVVKLHERSGTCVSCRLATPKDEDPPRPCPHSTILDGDVKVLARSGIKTADHRRLYGCTASSAEAMAGTSGQNLLFLLDEASGIESSIFQAIEGNRASGRARVVYCSNPTKTEGDFYEAFESKAAFFKLITISSEDTPNVRERREVIPGLAGYDYIEEKRAEWGPDSALYRIRIKGEFVKDVTRRIISVAAISEAEARWKETPFEGRLHIGIDPAGESGEGDETVIAVRRGMKCAALFAHLGLSASDIVTHVLGHLDDFGHNGERARGAKVVISWDPLGPAGEKLSSALRGRFGEDRLVILQPVRASDIGRSPGEYHKVRDELWANLANWLRAGGAIPMDTKLAKELHTPEFTQLVFGPAQATKKEVMKKRLGRSPDRADALALSVWEPGYDGAPDALPPPVLPAELAHAGVYGGPPAGLSPYGGRAYGGRT